MNNEQETKEYLKILEQIKLSHSSRARIKSDLVSYAQFHAAAEVKAGTTTRRKSLFMRSMFSPVPAAFALVFLVGTTSLLAKEAVPGDFLYAVKTGVSENIRGVFALVTNDTKQPDEPSQVQLADATKSDTDTATTSDTLAKNDKDRKNEKDKGNLAINTRTTAMMEGGKYKKDNMFAADTSLDLTTMLSKGTISIEDYTSDVELRYKTLRDLINKYDAEIDLDLKADFNKKLDTVELLVVKSEGANEAEARAHLNKANGLIGEVEAKLSTLGEATVKDGIITDIDFGVDVSAPPEDSKDDTKDSVDVESTLDGAFNSSSGLGL